MGELIIPLLFVGIEKFIVGTTCVEEDHGLSVRARLISQAGYGLGDIGREVRTPHT